MTWEAYKADALKRVRKAWLKVPIDANNRYTMWNIENEHIKILHAMHHMGVERTLFLRKVDPTVYRGIRHKVVRACQWCQSIDSIPSAYEVSGIHISNNYMSFKSAYYLAAYRPSGKGIIERHHRTARSKKNYLMWGGQQSSPTFTGRVIFLLLFSSFSHFSFLSSLRLSVCLFTWTNCLLSDLLKFFPFIQAKAYPSGHLAT